MEKNLMPVSYTYKIVEVSLELATVTVEIDFPDGTVDETTLSTRSFCTSDFARDTEILGALDSVIESYIFSTYPPPPPRPQALQDIVGVERVITL